MSFALNVRVTSFQGQQGIPIMAASMGKTGAFDSWVGVYLTTQYQDLGLLLAGMGLLFSCYSSSFRCRDVSQCGPVSQKWFMNPESHIKGTEMAQGCHFAFSVQGWSQHTSLQEFGHNCMSQTRPYLRGQKPGVCSSLLPSLDGGSLFRPIASWSCCVYTLWAEW